MKETEWVLIDTETTGFAAPIFVVELGAQKMRGWEPSGPPFRRLLNQNLDIPPEAARVHGYTREILERDGDPATTVYRDFADYAAELPIVAFNLEYDLTEVLVPEWKRLGIAPIGVTGFCALRLAQRLLDPVPAGNCKLQTLRQYYRLPERGAHTALGDVETVVDLLAKVLRPIAESWSDICAYAEAEWYPSRIAFGKFRGRHFQDAMTDTALMGWIIWLGRSTNGRTARMGRWYMNQLDSESVEQVAVAADRSSVTDHSQLQTTSTVTEAGIVIYANPEIEQLRQLVAAARARLAELEAAYTTERLAVDMTQAVIFKLLRAHYQARDSLRLIIDYRNKYLKILLRTGEDEAAQVEDEYAKSKAQSDANYEQAAATASGRKLLTSADEDELKSLWKKLVRLYHPDRFAHQPEKLETYHHLTSAINKAREDGDINLLREIANDPHGFILRSGWASLDFSDAAEFGNLRRLFDTLQLEIFATMELMNSLHASSEFELYQLSAKRPTLLDEIAAEQAKLISVEIEKLESEAAKLHSEITELTSESETMIK